MGVSRPDMIIKTLSFCWESALWWQFAAIPTYQTWHNAKKKKKKWLKKKDRDFFYYYLTVSNCLHCFTIFLFSHTHVLKEIGDSLRGRGHSTVYHNNDRFHNLPLHQYSRLCSVDSPTTKLLPLFSKVLSVLGINIQQQDLLQWIWQVMVGRKPTER